jgi:hypothetical protein
MDIIAGLRIGIMAGLRMGIMAGERANPVVVTGMRIGIMAGLRLLTKRHPMHAVSTGILFSRDKKRGA